MCVCGTTRPALVFGEGAMKRKDALCWLRGCKIKELCVQVILRLKKKRKSIFLTLSC
jgi:hypothetical protein